MNGEFFIYAIFVFALICALLVIFRVLIIAPKNRKAESSEEEADREREREERLFRLYQNMEEMMDNFEAYIEETKEQLEAAKADIRQQADTVSGLIRRVEEIESGAKTAVAQLRNAEKPAEPRKEAPAAASGGENGENGKHYTRQEAVRELLTKGLTVEQIARKLELSINEVRLVVYGLMAKKTDSK